MLIVILAVFLFHVMFVCDDINVPQYLFSWKYLITQWFYIKSLCIVYCDKWLLYIVFCSSELNVTCSMWACERWMQYFKMDVCTLVCAVVLFPSSGPELCHQQSAQLSRPQHLGNKGREEGAWEEEKPMATAADQSVDIAPPQPPHLSSGPPATLLRRWQEFPRTSLPSSLPRQFKWP